MKRKQKVSSIHEFEIEVGDYQHQSKYKSYAWRQCRYAQRDLCLIIDCILLKTCEWSLTVVYVRMSVSRLGVVKVTLAVVSLR